jgi:hypothetical protein
MTQHSGEQPASGAEPTLAGEDATLAAYLERDGAAWRAQVPPNDWLNRRVRALPSEQPYSAQANGAHHQLSQVEWTFEDSGPAASLPAAMVRGPTRRTGGWAAGISALVVVGMIAALLLGTRAVRDLQRVGLGSAQPTATPTPWSLQTPTVTYSPAAQYIANMITANGVDAANQPIEPASHFTQRAPIYLIVRLKNVPAGQHTLTVRWFLYGQRVQQPSNVITSIVISSSSVAVYFTCVYQMDGKGTAKVYWDLPAANSSDTKADAWLVGDVSFVVAPTPGPTPTTGPTPTP